MKTPLKLAIVAALVVTVVAAVTLKQNKLKAPAETDAVAVTAVTNAPRENTGGKTAPVANAKLPKLLDLGAGKCIPCKMMFPVLDELKKEYAGKLNVEFIDVWENPDAAKPYGIEVIPTQILYDADGKELFRHVGFFAKEDILAKWKELGVNFTDKSNNGK
ncbi:MAG: thioredoxin family protein [Limisphaerales bacterium]